MDRFMDFSHPQGQGPAHDRLDRRGGDRERAPELPGQGHRQLDQPGGRRGALRAVVPLLKTYGGAVVVGCIDEDKQQGMAVTRAAQARRRRALLRAAHGEVRARPRATSSSTPSSSRCGTGRRELHRARRSRPSRASGPSRRASPSARPSSASRTCPSACPPAGREVLNAVFLYHCTKAGPRLRHRQQRAARALRLHPRGGARARRGPDLLARGGSRGRLRRPLPRPEEGAPKPPRAALPLDERLARYIVEGSKDGLHRRPRAEARGGGRRSTIINGPLMKGMEEVGRLFNDNQLIVAEVLQSAEAMKAAVGLPRELHGEGRERRRAAPWCWPPSRATSTTSARTWSRSSSRTTATGSSTSASRCRPRI